ncbi:hypothetical protein NBRC116494_28570 [Aurantivibrio plasticivorans]
MDVNAVIVMLVVCAYGLWLAVAVFNNISDFQTNRALIARMVSMDDIKSDPVMGNNLQWRAMDGRRWSLFIFLPVVFYQVLTVAQFAVAGASVVVDLWTTGSISHSLVTQINIAFLLALMLWFTFLIGGLWFGYWIKMPQVQSAHLMLAMLTLFCITLVNILLPAT